MNKERMDYMAAREAFAVLEAQIEETEKKYIANNGIVNLDGTIPELICDIEDDEVFEKAVKEYSSLVAAGLDDKMNAVKCALKTAEDRLLELGISTLFRFEMRDSIQKMTKENICMRERMLSLILLLGI